MQKDIIALQKEFKRIKNMGWVREKRKGFTSGGYTFECLLKKDVDEFPLPDFGNIEIKTMNTHAKTNLHLFNLGPDGEDFFPIKRILEELGIPDKDDEAKKIFYRSFNTKEYNNIIYGRKGIIKVNYDKERVELLITDSKNNKVDINIYWSFKYIEERLNLKLRYLALVRASSRIIDGIGYYYYHTIKLYKLKDFNTFINLIEKGIIVISFKIGYYKSGKRIGNIYDHGTDFSISIDNLCLLYDEIRESKDQLVA